MHNKRVYDVSIAIKRIKNYCALQDRCQWDVLKKSNPTADDKSLVDFFNTRYGS